MTVTDIINELKKHYNPHNIEGMARYGIDVEKTFGVNVPKLRAIAKQTRLDSARLVGKNHTLAQELWQSGYHEARHIAAMIDDPKLVTKTQMNRWVRDFNSWDICDGTCSNLFRKTPLAFEKIFEWCERKEEYVRRAGFSLMAYLAVHDKKREDKDFLQFFPLIKKYSLDERNFVKKAVNWALRQIGKRNEYLNREALKFANEIRKLDSKSAKWIAGDAIRELMDPKILARIKR